MSRLPALELDNLSADQRRVRDAIAVVRAAAPSACAVPWNWRG